VPPEDGTGLHADAHRVVKTVSATVRLAAGSVDRPALPRIGVNSTSHIRPAPLWLLCIGAS
jgi:hypothetical protein